MDNPLENVSTADLIVEIESRGYLVTNEDEVESKANTLSNALASREGKSIIEAARDFIYEYTGRFYTT